MEGLDSFGLLEENGGYFVIEKEFEPMEQETGGTEAQAYSLPANQPEITAESEKAPVRNSAPRNRTGKIIGISTQKQAVNQRILAVDGQAMEAVPAERQGRPEIKMHLVPIRKVHWWLVSLRF